MKSLKYSSLTKMKKQKEEQKVQTSVLNTLKQDDQICTCLLDTLSEDYLGYLEGLMGKKTKPNQTSIKQSNQISRQKSEFLAQNFSSNKNQIQLQTVKTQQKKAQAFQQTQNLTPEKNKDVQYINLSESIVLIHKKQQQKSAEKQDLKESQQIPTTKQEQKKIAASQPNHQQKQADLKNTQTKAGKKQVKKSKDRKQSKVLIKNIEGYLQSLSKIKQQQLPLQNNHKGKKLSNELRKSQQTINFYKHEKKKEQNSVKNQVYEKKVHQIKVDDIVDRQRNEKIQNYFSQHLFKKAKTKLKHLNEHYHDHREEMTDANQSSEEKSEPSEQRVESSSDTSNNQTQSNDFERFLQKKNKQKEISYFKQYQVSNERYDQLSMNKQRKSVNNSLELLLIKVITKYNKLLRKQNKYKSKLETISTEFVKLQQQNKVKDFHIQKLTKINEKLITKIYKLQQNKKSIFSDPNSKYPAIVNYHHDVFHQQPNQAKNLRIQEKNEKDFRKKAKKHDGKAINIEKMFIIDGLELRNHKDKKQLSDSQFLFLKENQKTNFTTKNQNMEATQRQKRSVSCRETVRNKNEDSITINDLYVQSSFRNNRYNKSENKFPYKEKMPQKVNVFLDGPNNKNFNPSMKASRNKNFYHGNKTYGNQEKSYQQNQNQGEGSKYSGRKKHQGTGIYHPLDHKEVNMSQLTQNATLRQRSRTFSQSHNTLSLKRKQLANDNKLKFFRQNDEISVRKKYKGLDGQDFQSCEESQKDQDAMHNIRYFAKKVIPSASDEMVPNPDVVVESQSTDSQLLQKILCIKKNHNPSFSNKSYGSNFFFK